MNKKYDDNVKDDKQVNLVLMDWSKIRFTVIINLNDFLHILSVIRCE